MNGVTGICEDAASEEPVKAGNQGRTLKQRCQMRFEALILCHMGQKKQKICIDKDAGGN